MDAPGTSASVDASNACGPASCIYMRSLLHVFVPSGHPLLCCSQFRVMPCEVLERSQDEVGQAVWTMMEWKWQHESLANVHVDVCGCCRLKARACNGQGIQSCFLLLGRCASCQVCDLIDMRNKHNPAFLLSTNVGRMWDHLAAALVQQDLGVHVVHPLFCFVLCCELAFSDCLLL